MPELPEVESIARELHRELHQDHEIIGVKLYRQDLRVPITPGFDQLLMNESIRGVRRRAKYLLIDTDNHTILSHLGMSGSWRIEGACVSTRGPRMKPSEATRASLTQVGHQKHDHCEIIFQNGRRLIYHDPRRFGVLAVYPLSSEASSQWLNHLGPEPFDTNLTENDLKEWSANKKVSVKNFIMDQTVLVGVGNIYASEALFQARVRPSRRVSRLSRAEWGQLLRAIRENLSSSIVRGGTTLRDYRKASGDSGENQKYLKVYGRDGLACPICKDKIRHSVISARSTYWCPSCQK
jgi:formamidopyrimidine-DNA glycosylase